MLTRPLVLLSLAGAVFLLFAHANAVIAGETNREKAKQLNRMSVEASARGDEAKALATVNEAIRLDPTWDVSYYNRATFFMDKGEIELAIADYDTALGLGKEYLPLYYASRASAYGARGEFEKAIADLQKAMALDPNDYTLHGDLGIAYAYTLRWKDAIEECSIVLKRDADDYRSLVIRGATRCKIQDFDGGMADIEKAIRLDPKKIDAYAERAWALHDKGKDDEALKDCGRVLQSRPRNYGEARTHADIYRLRGIIRASSGDADAAIVDFSEALRMNRRHSAVLLDRGQLYGEKKEFKKALADFSESIRLCPSDPRSYELRSLAHFALGDIESASADQRKAENLRKAK